MGMHSTTQAQGSTYTVGSGREENPYRISMAQILFETTNFSQLAEVVICAARDKSINNQDYGYHGRRIALYELVDDA